jgi:hypothetical protein
MAGEFLRSFFEERGAVTEKTNGEADVLCPFEHDKGYEKRPSAHINLEKGTFHCKTCRAEGRFSNGGLSEINFAATFHNISYREAVRLIAQFEDIPESDGAWQAAVNNLVGQKDKMAYLAARGITEEEVLTYKLGYDGTGIVYPVYMYGEILDRRTYNMSPKEDEPKIKSQAGATPLLFPFDHWRATVTPTLLVGGENDALLGRRLGFNALTSTGGEGTFPAVFLGLFNGKDVYICYDCDEAGRKGALTVAFKLKEAGANVYIVDLGLAGTKEDKDLTDFVIKHGYGADELQEKLDAAKLYDGEQFQEAKNEHYPLVDLWKVKENENTNKYISSRVVMSGNIDTMHGSTMGMPAAVEWVCNRPNLNSDKSPCHTCKKLDKKGWWTLERDNLRDVLKMVEVADADVDKALNHAIGVPSKCPGVTKIVRDNVSIQKVVFTPDVETEDELHGYREAEMHAYTIDLDFEVGQRYRAFFKRCLHPKTQAQVIVVDKVEQSDGGINAFKMDEDMISQLNQFQGDPTKVMDTRFKLAKEIIAPSTPRQVFEAVNIMYHSVLDFKFHKTYMKGHPEGLIVGASRTGKTETALKWQQFLGIGNMTNVKGASYAGLVGGNDRMPNGGGFKIKWGTIPRNHKGMLILDEMSGIPQEVISKMTAMRSERKAVIEKMASGTAPAKTRMLWISNQRHQRDGSTKAIAMYNSGIDIVKELVGTNEDIARFDFVVTVPETESLISPFESAADLPDVDNTPYKNLVYWAWSRSQDEIKFAPNVEQYIWNTALELNEKYDTADLNVFGAETFKKLARIGVSCAAMCFSNCDDGSSILVRKEHIDWARDFIVNCYDNNVFRMADYVAEQKALTETTELVDAVFASLAKSHPILIKTLGGSSEQTMYNLQVISGLDKEAFNTAVHTMVKHGLVTNGNNGVLQPTLRFRNARNNYVNGIKKQKLIPLSEEGVNI